MTFSWELGESGFYMYYRITLNNDVWFVYVVETCIKLN